MVGRSRESAPWAGKPGSREPRIKAARRIGQRDAFPGGVGAAYAAGESGAADVGIAANLLPKPQPGGPGAFGQFAPNPEALAGKNFVDASRWVSLGSMTSRRNINRDIRSDIPIPKTNAISPWNQSSIDQQIVGRSLDC